ncbi:MAG: hypothetical protein ACPGO5_02140 [Patescibacteria group bacterium]
MPRVKKQQVWFFVKSVAVVALVLYPFYSAGRLLLGGVFVSDQMQFIVNTLFAPATWFLNVICDAMDYCVTREYAGADVMGPVYLVSVVLYGYFISLIWSWVDIPTRSKQRRRTQKYHEYDEFY